MSSTEAPKGPRRKQTVAHPPSLIAKYQAMTRDEASGKKPTATRKEKRKAEQVDTAEAPSSATSRKAEQVDTADAPSSATARKVAKKSLDKAAPSYETAQMAVKKVLPKAPSVDEAKRAVRKSRKSRKSDN